MDLVGCLNWQIEAVRADLVGNLARQIEVGWVASSEQAQKKHQWTKLGELR